MQIDYIKNPAAIVKRFDIPYRSLEEDLHLEGRVEGLFIQNTDARLEDKNSINCIKI